MAGGSHKGSSSKPPPSASSSSHRKSRWEPANNNHPSVAKAKSTFSAGSGTSNDSRHAKPSSDNLKPSSGNKLTPRRGGGDPGKPNPSPSTKQHGKTLPGSVSRGPFSPPSDPFSFLEPHLGPPPQPTYDFHMLERRTIVLADGAIRTYLALPPDYQDFVPPPRHLHPLGRFPPLGPDFGGPGRFPPLGPMSPDGFRRGEDQFGWNRNQDHRNPLGIDGLGGGPAEGSMKRKYGEEERDSHELARQRQHILQYGNVGANSGERNSFLPGISNPLKREDGYSRPSKFMRVDSAFDTAGTVHHYHSIDPAALKKAFLKFARLLNENGNQKKNYLENGKLGRLMCIACGRSSKDFPDVHGLILHAYNSDNADLRVDHLGLHKALCVLMGWNFMKPPDNSRAYQFLPGDEAAANQDDLIIWPPTVMIHNTSTGKGKEGRMEGLGNKAMDSIIRALGFPNGKSKSLYNKEGHLGIVLVKFAADQSGLREATRLAEYFEKENHGRKAWDEVQSMLSIKDEKNHPRLVKVDARSGEKKRIFYGHMFTAFDLDKVDYETVKKAVVESKREYMPTK